MHPFANYDFKKLDARCDHIADVIAPRKEELRSILEMHHNIVCSIPSYPDEEIARDAMADKTTFMAGVLIAKCYEIAMAEQNNHVIYPDGKLFDKVKCDLEADIAEMAQLERGAGSGRSH